ncbi:restriction endonuclease S subunit [Saprospira grandis DSM 2844]|uniref:Restriction endonuclease S subunit n=1 Tax=Saprospira grandis DSM 2844 TaxID=694433 RepID=J0Y0C4_9BACT|nr:restriction endonuclease subunit S [Saprospira grandis]EJF54976.1 restriction endonuclease S subunit [Saprospira grandis DSM 2844]
MKTEYKKTKLGLIPEDWEVAKLGDVAKVKTGNRDTKDKVENGQYPFFVRSDNVERINEYSYDGEAILTSGDGVGVGKNYHYINGRFNYHQRVYNIHEFRDNVVGKYLYYYFSKAFLKRVFRLSAKNSVDSVRLEMIVDMLIPLPPLPEQARIADCLSQWDRGIALLERLIAQKEEQKKGLMQQLLTGRQRLPGFAGEWERVKYGKAFDFLSTASFSRAKLFEGNDIQCLHYGDIHTKFHNYIDFEEFSIHGCTAEEGAKYSLLKNGDLIMADASEDLAGVGKSIEVKGLEGKAISGLHTILMRSKSNLFADGFKAYIHEIPTVRKSLQRIATGAKVYGVAKKNLKNISIPLPPLPEQKAIAQLLNTADRELSLLRAKLGQYRLQKRGIMQQLLTGRKRLV